jgi:hypothetical protein
MVDDRRVATRGSPDLVLQSRGTGLEALSPLDYPRVIASDAARGPTVSLTSASTLSAVVPLLVPDTSSDSSDSRRAGDAGTRGDAAGRIWRLHRPAGGRAVAGSNPVSPILQSRLGKRARAVPAPSTAHQTGGVVPPLVPLEADSLRGHVRAAATQARSSSVSRGPKTDWSSRSRTLALESLAAMVDAKWRGL